MHVLHLPAVLPSVSPSSQDEDRFLPGVHGFLSMVGWLKSQDVERACVST